MWIIIGLLFAALASLWIAEWRKCTNLTNEACPKSWSWTQNHLYGYRKYGDD